MYLRFTNHIRHIANCQLPVAINLLLLLATNCGLGLAMCLEHHRRARRSLFSDGATQLLTISYYLLAYTSITMH